MPGGALAQLGEHLLCKQGVIGSIPIGSTKLSDQMMVVESWLARTHFSRDEDTIFHSLRVVVTGDLPPLFDIVNGFLIDAVAHRLAGFGRRDDSDTNSG